MSPWPNRIAQAFCSQGRWPAVARLHRRPIEVQSQSLYCHQVLRSVPLPRAGRVCCSEAKTIHCDTDQLHGANPSRARVGAPQHVHAAPLLEENPPQKPQLVLKLKHSRPIPGRPPRLIGPEGKARRMTTKPAESPSQQFAFGWATAAAKKQSVTPTGTAINFQVSKGIHNNDFATVTGS